MGHLHGPHPDPDRIFFVPAEQQDRMALDEAELGAEPDHSKGSAGHDILSYSLSHILNIKVIWQQVEYRRKKRQGQLFRKYQQRIST